MNDIAERALQRPIADRQCDHGDGEITSFT
jgi:hypothetical protein